jgi:hypothetical protein
MSLRMSQIKGSPSSPNRSSPELSPERRRSPEFVTQLFYFLDRFVTFFRFVAFFASTPRLQIKGSQFGFTLIN